MNVRFLSCEYCRWLIARGVSFGAALDATDEGRGDAFPAEPVIVQSNCDDP